MKKFTFLFATLLVGVIAISAGIEKQLIGKWHVHSLKMMEGEAMLNEEVFDDAEDAPWMEFKEDNVLILGEPGRTPKDSKWKYNKETNTLMLDSFGDEIEFTIPYLTDSQLILEAEQGDKKKMTLTLKR